MVSLEEVERQLQKIGCNFRFWGRPEVKELCNILSAGEVIAQCANGRYENGFAILCATSNRLLLVDKKPLFLKLEDIRFDMIAELDYTAQLFEGTINIMTPGRILKFTSWNHGRLRGLLNYTQQRVTDIRQHYIQRQFQSSGRDGEVFAASAVGDLALRNNHRHRLLSLNPYANAPLTVSRHRIPKFYPSSN